MFNTKNNITNYGLFEFHLHINGQQASYDEQAFSLFNSSTNKVQVETQHINFRRKSVKSESYVIV